MLLVVAIAAFLFPRFHKPAADISGAWAGRFSIPGLSDREANRYQSWTLRLNKDGTFTGHLEMHIMVDIVEDDRGTYVLSGTTLRLKGSSESTANDGYKKERRTGEVDYKFALSNETLSLASGGLWGGNVKSLTHIVFWREGSVPVPPPPPRDPKGAAILQKVEGVYKSLKSYEDGGTFLVSGPGSSDWKIVFLTRFSRSRAFRFESTIWEGGQSCEQDAVWYRGGKAWMSMSLDGGARHQGRLEDCLRYVAHSVGIEALLIPHLLAPSEFTRTLSKAYPGIALRRVEKVGSEMCSVLELSNPDEGMHLTVWVDRASNMILQASPFENCKIRYKPLVNPPLSDRDLAGHQVPPGKARPHHQAPRGSESDP